MTQPGTTGNAIPRGRDWIARDLADLRRMIRRLGASASTTVSGGGPVGSAKFHDNTGSSSDGYFLDCSTAGATTGDASSMTYDASGGGDPAIMLSEVGWYQAQVTVALSGAGTPTHPIAVKLQPAGSFLGSSVTSWIPANATNWNDVSATSAVFYVGSTPDWVYASTVNPDGLLSVGGFLYVVRLA